MFHSFAASGSLPMNWANSAASFGCCDEVKAAKVEPPQFEVTLSPFSHCGIGAARHWPKLFFIDCCISTGAQAAVTQEA